RGQRRQDGDRVDVALVEHAEHDVDRDDRGQDQPGLSGQRAREFGGVAGIDADDAAGHPDPGLDRLHRLDRVAERFAGRQVEAERDRRKLGLMRDRERRRGADQGCHRRQRHLRAVGAGQIELVENRRVALVHRQRLEHDAVLVGLAVDRRDLALREGVVQRIRDTLETDAKLAGALAVDVERRAQAALLRLRRDVAEDRVAPHFGDKFPRPLRDLGGIGRGQRVLVLRTARLGRDLHV
ncbi:hypothetical protein chiPu_0030707, partial [Chiloscyllium punctatum]|nr:hypothetical protein [Chiloscyllium punctatum]